MLKRLDHVGIVVDDLNDAKRLLGETLGLRLVRELEVAELARRVAFFQCGDAQIEVIEDLDSAARLMFLAARRLASSTSLSKWIVWIVWTPY